MVNILGTKTIAMVRLDFQFTCPEWENTDGETIEESDMDKASEMLLKKEIYEALSDVEPEWTPKEGIFLEQDPKKIANYLLKNSDSKGQAMKRLTFYMNRAGENLKNKTVLNKVKALLKSDEE